MTYLNPARVAILGALRYGALDPFAISAAADVAPFTVRAELRALKRERLVAERLTDREHCYALTDRGHRIVNEADQLRFR